MDIKDRVINIIAEQAVLEPSDVTMVSTLDDLGIDSLGHYPEASAGTAWCVVLSDSRAHLERPTDR